MITLPESIIRQYSKSTNLISFIEKFDAAMDTPKNIDDFITNILDIDTCGSYGLDVWGRIVNISRYLIIELDIKMFGLVEAKGVEENYPAPFNDGPLYNGSSFIKRTKLSDAAYRRLIKCKMLSNISGATSTEINILLIKLFSDKGRCYCRDNGDMTIDLVFNYKPSQLDIAIINNTDVIPVMNGVKKNIKVEI